MSVNAVCMQQHSLDKIHQGRKHSYVDVSNHVIFIPHYVSNLFKIHTYSSSLNVMNPKNIFQIYGFQHCGQYMEKNTLLPLKMCLVAEIWSRYCC